MSRVCIDLCCGLGGFSQAFKDSPDWEVITVDIDPKFKPTVIADVTRIDWARFKEDVLKGREVDVLLMSPPCERTSIANSTWPKEGIGKALQIVGACLEAVVSLHPKFWMLENPKGRLRWFIGKPGTTIYQSDFGRINPKPTDLWGNIDLGFLPSMNKRKNLSDWSDTHGYSSRSLIPLGLSQTILKAVTTE
jgi:site-specific DNA-cytosine methylase